MSEYEQRMAFAQALQDARKQTGISQKVLAEALGVIQGTVSAYERGGVEPPPQQVFALEAALNLPGGFLSRHLGYIPAPTGDSNTSADQQVVQTAAAKHALEDALRIVQDTADSIKKMLSN